MEPTELERVATAAGEMSAVLTPSPVSLLTDHPRLGGWAELAEDPTCLRRLPAHSAWAASNLQMLIELERDGLAAAQGTSLVHFDLYAFNTLLTPDRVVFVDWPHARMGAPFVDLVMMLSSAAADGIDVEPLLRRQVLASDVEPHLIDGVLAAHAGFLTAGGLYGSRPEYARIREAKRHLSRGAIGWLQQRVGD